MNTETTIRADVESLGPVGPREHPLHLLVMSPEVFFSQPMPEAGSVTIGRSSSCDVRVEDRLASRQHARIHVQPAAGAPALTIVDAGSANGTHVRDAAIKPGEPVTIVPGEAVTIGTTMIMVLQGGIPAGPRRLWSHAHFESRIEDECARAMHTGAPFALGRLRFDGAAPWTTVLPILARDLLPPNVFAGYGPKDYEILFVDVKEGEVERMVETLVATCRASGLEATSAVAWYPQHGRAVDSLLARANALLKTAAGSVSGGDGPVDFAGMQRVRDMAARVASSSINVLILGETGAGKEVLARLIHQLSPRDGSPFVALNCAGLSQTLIESELFGYEKGAFTGATATKVGILESASGGTVFLDEIGEMPLPMQAKLLRVIEAREVMPVGAVRPRPINVRFVSATNRDLEAAVAQGAFRSDLLFRLNVMTLPVPPLRERAGEIPTLVDTFVAAACRESGRKELPRVTPDAMRYLLQYRWPGNIRELKNVLERAVVLCDGAEIGPQHLPLEKMRPPAHESSRFPSAPTPAPAMMADAEDAASLPPLSDPRKAAERKRIVAALADCASNQTRAAQLLGMPRRTFVSKLDYYGIPRPQKGHFPEGRH